MWYVWNKQSDINGVPAESFLARHNHLQKDPVVYIKVDGGKVSQVEGKHTLAIVYGIDETLNNEKFISEYERVISMPLQEVGYEETARKN
jgi:hypothetical protein